MSDTVFQYISYQEMIHCAGQSLPVRQVAANNGMDRIGLSCADSQVVEEALRDAGKTKEDVDWLVLHQANQRILDAAAQRLGFAPNQVVSNLAEYGNTSAASIPLVLDEAVRKGDIQDGSMVSFLHG